MIDIHSHILPGIDDGSRSMKESINIIKSASINGVTDIIVTPHYIYGSDYVLNNADKKKLLTKLKREVKKEKIDINLYLGNEVFVENNMLELNKKGEISTLNDSKYLLFELPLNYEFKGVEDIIYNLKCKGIIPVIAHPERYSFLKKNPKLIESLINAGAIFQSNIGSFLGTYGKEAKSNAILFLKHNMISFISSDVHHDNIIFYEQISNLKEMMKDYISDEEITNLFEKNARCILNNEVIKNKEFIPIKKGLFGKFK